MPTGKFPDAAVNGCAEFCIRSPFSGLINSQHSAANCPTHVSGEIVPDMRSRRSGTLSFPPPEEITLYR